MSFDQHPHQTVIPVYRPLEGPLVPIEEVPDPVFSSKLLGDGVAVRAESGVLRSPVDGEVSLLFPSMHAIAIRTTQGLDIMIHIGLDTVELQGMGFVSLVEPGDSVRIGQELIRFDLPKIAATHSLLTPVLVTDMERVERIEPGTEEILYFVVLKQSSLRQESRDWQTVEQSISGLALSDGIAMGTAVVFRPEYNVKRYRVADRLAEVDRFRQAVLNAKADLGDLIETAITRLSAQEVEILSVQELLLEDPLVTDEILEEIGQTGFNAEAVVWDVMQRWIQEFTEMEDPYMRGRAIDLIDVRDRLLRMLEGAFHTAPGFGKGSILVMEELPPTIVGDPNLENIGGVVTAKGNETSHGSILARSIGIPLVSGMGDKMAGILPGDFLIVDGTNGQVIINPSPETIERYREQLARRQEQERELLTWRDKQAITQDQYKISVGANIGGLADTKRARKFGADEIGLFRTEVLFMSYGHWPSEEEQFDWYKRILLEMEGRPVIFRVLDIGGDKPLPYFPIEEQNPFLGYRGVRVLFDQIRLFREQLRALYRASRFGPVRIMFPMIHSVEEWKSIQVICEDVRAETGVEPVDLGLMVETPAAALLIDYFVEHVQFISIGTNDLTQYTLAVDRQNDRVKDLYDPLHPAVLRLIRKVAQSAAKKNVWVGVCGELAGDETMLPFWIGLGVNELSVNPNRVLSIKKRISDLSRSEAQQLVANLDNAMTREDVNRILFGKSI